MLLFIILTLNFVDGVIKVQSRKEAEELTPEEELALKPFLKEHIAQDFMEVPPESVDSDDERDPQYKTLDEIME